MVQELTEGMNSPHRFRYCLFVAEMSLKGLIDCLIDAFTKPWTECMVKSEMPSFSTWNRTAP